MRKHITIGAAGIALTAIFLAGCSAGAADSNGPVTLTFQSLAFQDTTIQATQDIVDKWNKDNPDIQVDILQSNFDDVHDQLVTQFQSNTPPDLIYDEASDLAGFAHQGYLADLTPYLSDDLKAAVPEDFWDIVTIDGQIIAAPTLVQSYVAFANTDAFAAAGVDVPAGDSLSWDDLRALAKQLTSGDKYGAAWGLKQPASAIMNTSLTYGGTFFDVADDGSATIDVGSPELAVPEQLHKMLIEDKSMDPTAATQSTSDVIPGFLGGKYAIYLGANYLAQQLTEAAPEGFNFTVLPALAGSDGTAQAANPQTISIAAQSKHPEQAAQFLDYFLSAENQATLGQSDWLRPVSTDALEQLKKNTADTPIWEPLLAASDGLTGAPFTKTLDYPQWKLQYATPGLQQYLAGSITKEQLGQKLSDGWNTITGG